MSLGSPPELHLPGLPEVHLGGPAPAPLPSDAVGTAGTSRQRLGWGHVLRQSLGSYLPLLLMAALAAGTGWLVKNTPQRPAAPAATAVRQTPDYTMRDFSITRFDAGGRVALRIDGDVMRHYPATDRLDIDGVRIHAIAPDGRVTDATARRALANGDGSEVQLIGDARVQSQLAGSDQLVVRGEFLHAFLRFERLRSHLPVHITRSGADTQAAGMDYDHVQQVLQLVGPVRAQFRSGRAGAAVAGDAGPGPGARTP